MIFMANQLIEAEIILKEEYDEFIKTDEGKIWKEAWQMKYGIEMGDFVDFLYDFYPEFLQ